MNPSLSRRNFLLATVVLPLASTSAAWASDSSSTASAEAYEQLKQLELALDGRLGVFALNTANGAQLCYRANERFAFCSTFKMLLAAAILEQSQKLPELLQQRIKYAQTDLVSYSPITEKHLKEGMSVADLCAATVQYSDNTAANLLLKKLGGLGAMNAYAKSIGDEAFRLDRWEPELNSAIPGDARDTTTPQSMGRSLQRLALEDALKAPQRTQLNNWLIGNTTGAARIRAGIPAGWLVGDKTGGGGAYGTANDIAVIWPPNNRPPIVVAIYTVRQTQDAPARNDIVASAARTVVDWIS